MLMFSQVRDVPMSGAILQQKVKDFACILGHNDFQVCSGYLCSRDGRIFGAVKYSI